MKKNNDRFYPYILIFFMIYKMNKNKDNPEYFFELKSLLKNSLICSDNLKESCSLEYNADLLWCK